MLIMEEELVPNKSYAGFVLGEDIHKYLGSNRIYDIQIIDGTIKVKNYGVYDPEISIDTICSKIQNIDCEKTCYWQGKNLIGMCYKDFLEMVKILPDEKDIIYLPIYQNRGQNHKVYTFYSLGLMIWVWRDKIRSVTIFDGTVPE